MNRSDEPLRTPDSALAGGSLDADRAAAESSSLERSERLEMHLFLRLAREWDLRFEKMFKTGALSKWYSSVGNEATTVAAATPLEPGDALVSLHRDAGAILRHYLDIEKGNLFRALGRYNGSLGKARYPNLVLSKWERHWTYVYENPNLTRVKGKSGASERQKF